MGRALGGALLAVATLFGTTALGQESGKKQAAKNITVSKVFRASTIKGMAVYNLEGDRVGTIDELVIDVEKGQVVYAALSVGGFLGAGDKLFAIPWREFTLEMDQKDKFFRLDIDKDKLKAAEGFDKNAWPDVADPKWAEKIESQFKERRTTSTKTTTTTKTRKDRD